jgi:uncharacterized phage-like protein YoqJ
MINKSCCFAGHREEFRNIGIENKLRNKIEKLVNEGYIIFYNGDHGYFDKLSARIVYELKKKYPQIKLIKILSSLTENNGKKSLKEYYDSTIYPNIENIYPKEKIIECNKWMINNSDILICHITNTYHSGAYKTLLYAKQKNKHIEYI